MPEHVHLLVNEPKGALLSRAVQALKLSVSMRRRERPFWQAHYYDFNVSSHEKFVEKLRYIHRNPGAPTHEHCVVGWNPVRRGLVAKPEDWAWSSFRHYQTGMRGTVEIESEWTARGEVGNCPCGCATDRSIPAPRSPKARDRGHPRLHKSFLRSEPPAEKTTTSASEPYRLSKSPEADSTELTHCLAKANPLERFAGWSPKQHSFRSKASISLSSTSEPPRNAPNRSLNTTPNAF